MAGQLLNFLIILGTVLQCTSVQKDVLWLLDASKSVTEQDHNLVRDFIYNVTSYLTISAMDIRMGIVKFDVEINKVFQLNDYSDNEVSLLNMIEGMSYKASSEYERKTMDALTYSKTQFLNLKGGRDSAKKVLIVIVNGPSSNTTQTISVADSLRSEYNAEIFTIGIGPNLTSTNTELKRTASDPDSYYLEYIGNFINLCGILPSLVTKLDNTTSAELLEGCIVWIDPTETPVEVPQLTDINEGLSTGATVLLVLAFLLLLLLALLLLFLLYRRNRKKRKKDKVGHDEDVVAAALNYYGDKDLGEKRYMYKRNTTVSDIPIKLTTKVSDNDFVPPVKHTIKQVHEDKVIPVNQATKLFSDTESLNKVYENLGERSVTASVVDLKFHT